MQDLKGVRTIEQPQEPQCRDRFYHLVNNAGQGEIASIAETTRAQFGALCATHVKGVFFLTQAPLPMLADGRRIVNFSSGLTRVSFPGFSAYAAAKGAVEVMTVHMAKELGNRGITANTVAPARSRPTSWAARCATCPA